MISYTSTRGEGAELPFADVLLTGLAPDGGLYVPTEWPTRHSADPSLPYAAFAAQVMWPFVNGSIERSDFEAICASAYATFADDEVIPVVAMADGIELVELFHGPTLAFKDVAMQLLGRLFDYELTKRSQHITIVGATSGDTGSAAIEAFRDRENVDIVILHPHGRTSDVQRRQMTTVDAPNVRNVAIEGTFDDCQDMVKAMFADTEFNARISMSAVNSINWARVLAQVVYYFSSAVSLGSPDRKVSFTVPTGNFGDIFAGYVAKQMGLPIDRLVVATNQNDILHRCLSGQGYHKGPTHPSISPSMDIQVSSNFERALFEAYDRDGTAVSQLMEELGAGAFNVSQGALQALRENYDSGRCDEDETRATIRDAYTRTGELLCPHGAVGVKVAEEQRDAATPMITLATAHPAKFPDAVEAASGLHPPLPPAMSDLYEREERITRVANDLGAIETLIRERTGN